MYSLRLAVRPGLTIPSDALRGFEDTGLEHNIFRIAFTCHINPGLELKSFPLMGELNFYERLAELRSM